MDCPQVEKFLSDYVDGILDAATKERMEKHISTCRKCSEELREMRAVSVALRSLDEVKAPPDFLQSVHGRIKQQSFLRKVFAKFMLPAKVGVPLGAAGLVVALLVVVVTYLEMQPAMKHQKEMGVARESKPAVVFNEREEITTGNRPRPESPLPSPAAEENRTPIIISLAIKSAAVSPSKSTRQREPAAAESTSGAGMETRQKPKAQSLQDNSRSLLGMSVPSESPLKEKEPELLQAEKKTGGLALNQSEMENNLVSWIERTVEKARGRLLSIEYHKESTKPHSVLVSIPAESLAGFLKSLETVSESIKVSGLPPSLEGQQLIRARIDLRY